MKTSAQSQVRTRRTRDHGGRDIPATQLEGSQGNCSGNLRRSSERRAFKDGLVCLRELSDSGPRTPSAGLDHGMEGYQGGRTCNWGKNSVPNILAEENVQTACTRWWLAHAPKKGVLLFVVVRMTLVL